MSGTQWFCLALFGLAVLGSLGHAIVNRNKPDCDDE